MPSSNPDLAHYFFHKLPFNHTNINREREYVNMFLYAFRKKNIQKFRISKYKIPNAEV